MLRRKVALQLILSKCWNYYLCLRKEKRSERGRNLVALSKGRFFFPLRVMVPNKICSFPWVNSNSAPFYPILFSQEVTNDAFEFTSDSEAVMGSTLRFSFSSYATMTAVELKFPVGDTYKFSLELYDSYSGDPVLSITVRSLGSAIETCIRFRFCSMYFCFKLNAILCHISR